MCISLIYTGIALPLPSSPLKRKDGLEPVTLKKGNYTKRKKPNLFREINLPDELDGFDFLFEKSPGKFISQKSKHIISANDISPLSQGRAIQQGKNFTVLKTRKTHVEIKDNHINKQSN